MTRGEGIPAEIDVIVPVHSPERPIARLAESVFDGTSARVRLLVIAHNTPVAPIRAALGPFGSDPRIEIVPFRDGIASPAGPFTHGLSLVRAPWFTKIDSDDLLSPGALDSWLRTARRFQADAVIPRMVLELSRVDFPTPPRRLFHRLLDPLRDRLAYRTSTMGLLAASLIPSAVPTPGLPTAEDVLPSLRLWFSARRIAHADDDAPYIVGEIAVDRVTESSLPFSARLAFVESLVDDPFIAGLTTEQVTPVVRKVLRVHVLGALASSPDLYDADARGPVAEAIIRLERLSPSARSRLSRADGALVASLLDPAASAGGIRAQAVARRRYVRIAALLPVRTSAVLSVDAPLRFLAASALVRLRGRARGRASAPGRIAG